MTLLDMRKTVLREMAQEINESCFGLLKYIAKNRISIDEAGYVLNKIDEFESVMSYIRSEAELLNRDIVSDAAREVEKIWQDGSK